MKRHLKAAAGFTLVELIVVIAILGILSGVAVPAYSGYVKKANMAADQQLVNDVANALVLHYYGNPSEEMNGLVVLKASGGEADAVGTAAVDAMMGDGWENTVKLKYDGWNGNGPKSGNVSRVALEQALVLKEDGMEGAIGDSSFITGSTPAELMTNVTDLTYVATGLFNDMNEDIKYSVIRNNLFNSNDTLLEAYCKDFGITTSKDANDLPVFGDDVTDEQLANLLVFGAAQQISSGAPESTVVSLVFDYAAYAGYVNSAKGTDKEQVTQEAYAKLNEDLGKDNNGDGKINSDDVSLAFQTFQNNAAFKTEFDAYKQDENPTYNRDMTAFYAIMGAVDEASGTVTPEDMKQGDFFTSDHVSGFFNTYLTAAEAASKMDADQIEAALEAMGAGGIVVTMNGGSVADSAGILQQGN